MRCWTGHRPSSCLEHGGRLLNHVATFGVLCGRWCLLEQARCQKMHQRQQLQHTWFQFTIFIDFHDTDLVWSFRNWDSELCVAVWAFMLTATAWGMYRINLLHTGRWANDEVGPIMHHGVKDPKDVTSFYYQEPLHRLKSLIVHVYTLSEKWWPTLSHCVEKNNI